MSTYATTPGLCEICASIDLRRWFTVPTYNEEIELGAWEAIQLRGEKCCLCRAITNAIRGGPWAYTGKLGQEDGFVLVPRETITLRCRETGTAEPVPQGHRLHIVTDSFRMAGDLLLDLRDAHQLSRPAIGNGRQVNPAEIDNSLVQAWISDCETQHSKCAETYKSISAVRQLPDQSLLIDVNAQCLVHAPPQARYAALSYKWGEVPQYLTTTSEFANLKQEHALISCPLPQTVRDALTLTKNIGIDYLWVDALCIIQDSSSHKASQISQMHRIYGGATVTIVAASSENADDGLPGVGSRPRDSIQPVVTVNGLRILPRVCFTGHILKTSAYSQRAWTYQEFSFSRRVLIVTSKGVHMECASTVYNEELALENGACDIQGCQDHHLNLDTDKGNLWHDFLAKRARTPPAGPCECMRQLREEFRNRSHRLPENPQSSSRGILLCDGCVSFEENSEAGWLMYQTAVRRYTCRQLRFESDRMAAFAGIAGILSEQFETRFLYCLPEKYLELALSWFPTSKLDRPCRRAGLHDVPSWSWASHEVAVEYSHFVWLTSEVDWHRLVDGEVQPVHSLKRFGQCPDLRDDFWKPVTRSQLAAHHLPFTDEKALWGWCQIVTSFFLNTTTFELCDQHKTSIDSTVQFSDMPPEYEQEFHPVEVLFLSRSYFEPLVRIVDDWELEPHFINLLIIESDGVGVRRLARALVSDTRVWKETKKEWRLVSLV